MEEHLKVLFEAYTPKESGNGIAGLFWEHLTPNTVKTLLENVIIRKLIPISQGRPSVFFVDGWGLRVFHVSALYKNPQPSTLPARVAYILRRGEDTTYKGLPGVSPGDMTITLLITLPHCQFLWYV